MLAHINCCLVPDLQHNYFYMYFKKLVAPRGAGVILAVHLKKQCKVIDV